MAKSLEHILDECIDRVIEGEDITRCLEDHPEFRAELEPLLRLALVTSKASSLAPRPEFKAQARYQLRLVLDASKGKERGRRFAFSGWRWGWTWGVAVILAFLLAGGGTVVASADSLPDQPLYLVKLTTERMRLALPRSDMSKARLYLKLADRRVDEIARMVEKGKPGEVAALTDRLSDHLESVELLFEPRPERTPRVRGLRMSPPREMAPAPLSPAFKAGGQDEGEEIVKLRALLQRNAARHEAAFQRLLEKAPPSARLSLRHASEMTRKQYGRALQSLGAEED